MELKPQHYIACALVLLLGYYLGIKYPGPGTMALSKVGA